jgi:hypothetical protein
MAARPPCGAHEVSVPFWTVVLVTLIGVPMLLFVTGMAMIFWSAGLAGGPQESRATTIVRGWLAVAWVLASAFGAFGLAPAWRAWHIGQENFDGALRLFVDWLIGIGGLGAVAAATVSAPGRQDAGSAPGSPLAGAARWLLLALGFAPWAAIAAWVVWPLVSWPVRGRFEWPDATTGWTHTAEALAVLFAAMLAEDAIRQRRG